MKQLPIIIGAVIIIAIAAAGFILTRSSNPPTSSLVNQQSSSGPTTLKSLLALGQNQKCTYEFTDDITGNTQGTIYISGGKMRSDYTFTARDGQNYQGSTINDSTYIYSWSTVSNQGSKFAINETESVESNDKTTKGVNPDEELNYKCGPWAADSSVFNPPSNIQFTDSTSMMQQIDEQGSGMKTSQCSTCENLEGEAQSSCKQALNCE